MNYGLLTLLPALAVVLFALKTRRTLEALLLGTLLSYLITDGPNFLSAWMEGFFSVATTKDVQWVIIICLLFGGFIALMGASRGTFHFSSLLQRFCRTKTITLLVTWILGILIFIDDYLNIITLAVCMRPVTDIQKIPRESLAYIIDSTGAPVCVLLPFSTWAIFYASVFFQQSQVAALGYGNAMQTYIHLIPYTFYAILTLIVVFLFCMGWLPKVGRMKTAYARCADGKVTGIPEKSDKKTAAKGSLWDFLLPLVTVIVLVIANGEMFIALVCGLAVCLLLYLPRKLMSFGTFCDTFMDGFTSLLPTVAVVFAAFLMQEASVRIGLANYVIGLIRPFMQPSFYPALAFVTIAVLTFITGSNWGIPAVCVPVLVPLGFSIGANPLLVMAAILSGGTFGSHACFYSDATVLTSTSCELDNLSHALSQFPYACLGAVLTFFLYLLLGFFS